MTLKIEDIKKCPNCQSENITKSGNSIQCLADDCGIETEFKNKEAKPKEKSKLEILWEEKEAKDKNKSQTHDPDED